MAFPNFHHPDLALLGQRAVRLQIRDRFGYREVFIRPPTTVAMNNQTFQRHAQALGFPHASLKLVRQLNTIDFFSEAAPAKLLAPLHPYIASTLTADKDINDLVSQQIHAHVEVIMQGICQHPRLKTRCRQNSERETSQSASADRPFVMS